jgi:hypothetical protein
VTTTDRSKGRYARHLMGLPRHLSPNYWRDRVWQELADANLEHDVEHEHHALDDLARLPEQREESMTTTGAYETVVPTRAVVVDDGYAACGWERDHEPHRYPFSAGAGPWLSCRGAGDQAEPLDEWWQRRQFSRTGRALWLCETRGHGLPGRLRVGPCVGCAVEAGKPDQAMPQ